MAALLRVVLIITGLTGIHSITTVSKVSVKAGASISIPCLYGSQYLNNVKFLCKGFYWNYCSYAIKSNGRSSGKFSISDDKSQRIFTVAINNLTDRDTYYWCAVEIDRASDVREYFELSVTGGTPALSVDNQKISGFKGGNIAINCSYRHPGEMKWCRLGGSCVSTSSGSIDGTGVTIDASVSNVFTVTMSGLRTESSGWYWCVNGDLQMPVHVTVTDQSATTSCLSTVSLTPEPVNLTTERPPTTVQSEQLRVSVDLKRFIIALSVLIFIVIVILFILFMLKRRNWTKASASAMKGSHAESDMDVMYSPVNIKRQDVPRVEANENSVIYSTLA